VSDTGPGIPLSISPEFLKNSRELLCPDNRNEGHRLGLSIASQLSKPTEEKSGWKAPKGKDALFILVFAHCCREKDPRGKEGELNVPLYGLWLDRPYWLKLKKT
jgi:hypothetical protein